MTFTFLHTGDWQIGKRFAAFDAERKDAILREARLSTITRIGELAQQSQAEHVLVAGDVFDGEALSDRTLRQPFERMAAFPKIQWHLLPGNHDPDRPGGVWEQALRLGLAENIHVHRKAEAVPLTPEVWLLPAPLRKRATAMDPTAWMDRAETPKGAIRLGLAHGSIRGFGSDVAGTANLIDPRRPEHARLAYLALGDWHGWQKITDRCWYAGTPEPDRWPDNTPGYVLQVTIPSDAKAPPEVTPVKVAQFQWLQQAITITKAQEIEPLVTEILGDHPPERVLLSLTLSGLLTLPERERLAEVLARLDARFFHLQVDQTALRLRPDTKDLDRLGPAGELRAAAERLQALAESEPASADDNAPHIAQEALVMLFALAQEAENEIDAEAAS